jgi:hypothetical protein
MNGGRRYKKESNGGSEFKCDIFDAFVNATIYPHPTQQ